MGASKLQQKQKKMIENITKDLTKEEAEVLTKTFIRLEDFFNQLP